ncbi:MAG TPA: hypothetical protein DC058_23795 [Planctomycetaceae bacterium]|nr:hypothetical protein [Planctomycetaceae bacterium]
MWCVWCGDSSDGGDGFAGEFTAGSSFFESCEHLPCAIEAVGSFAQGGFSCEFLFHEFRFFRRQFTVKVSDEPSEAWIRLDVVGIISF